MYVVLISLHVMCSHVRTILSVCVCVCVCDGMLVISDIISWREYRYMYLVQSLLVVLDIVAKRNLTYMYIISCFCLIHIERGMHCEVGCP